MRRVRIGFIRRVCGGGFGVVILVVVRCVGMLFIMLDGVW